MCFVNGRADLFENIERPCDRQILFFFKYLAERAAVEIFHHEIRDLALVGLGKSEVGDVDDIRMPQTPRSTSLAPKPLDKLGPLHKLRRNDLDRDRPLGAEVGRKIHRPHPAASKLAFNTVFVVEGSSDH